MFRYFHLQNPPGIFNKHLLTNKEIHTYNTGNASLLHKSCTRTNNKKPTLGNKGINVWNNLATQYKQIRSLPIFKSTMKIYFLLSNLNK
jgi:hypothetical protein